MNRPTDQTCKVIFSFSNAMIRMRWRCDEGGWILGAIQVLLEKHTHKKMTWHLVFRRRISKILTSTRTKLGRDQLSATQTNDSTQANTKKKQGGRLWNMSASSTF